MFNLCGDHAQSARKPRSITAESMLNFAGFAAQTQRRMQLYGGLKDVSECFLIRIDKLSIPAQFEPPVRRKLSHPAGGR